MSRTLLFPSLLILTLIFSIFPSSASARDGRIDKLEKELQSAREENRKLGERLSDTLKEQNKSIEELKEKTKELKETVELVESEAEETQSSMISNLVNISGYADAEFRLSDKDNQNNYFRIRHLSLFFSKEIHKHWKFFSEIEFEDAPLVVSKHTTDEVDRVQGKILVEQAYIEYRPMLGLDVKFGRFLTPAGIWTIFHYYPYVPTQTRPIMIRKMFPQVSDGIQVSKMFTVGSSMLATHLYVANGSGNPAKLDRNQNKAIGAMVNYSPDLLDGFEVGFSYYGETDNEDVDKKSYGIHLKATYGDFEAQTEYMTRTNKPDAGGDYDDTGLYAQLSYDYKKWTTALRYDWYDVNDSIKEADQYRYTAALNYHFAHNVVGKVEYNINRFEDSTDEDFNEAIASIVVAIGDL